jgi:hypothetical protein
VALPTRNALLLRLLGMQGDIANPANEKIALQLKLLLTE